MQTVRRNWRHWIVGTVLGLALCGMLAAVIANHFDRPDVVVMCLVVGITCLMALPIVWFSTIEPVLFVGVLPSAVIWFAISVPKMLAEVDQDYTLITFLLYAVWALLLSVWAPAAWFSFRLNRRCKKRLVWGPLIELIAVTLLMAPWILAAFVLPSTVSADHQIFTIVASIGIGLLWSKVLSEPFAQLVRVLREQS